MRLVTFATDLRPAADFLASCKRMGALVSIIGQGEPYPGHLYRVKRLYPFVRALPPEEVVLFADAFDSLLAAPLETIERRFFQRGCNLLFGAETYCAPHPQIAPRYPESGLPYRYINAGGYIGYAGAIVRLWDALNLWRLPDAMNDQGVIVDYWLAHPNAFELDYRQELIQNLFGAECHLRRDPLTGRLINTLTGATAGLYHASGGSDASAVRQWLLEENP